MEARLYDAAGRDRSVEIKPGMAKRLGGHPGGSSHVRRRRPLGLIAATLLAITVQGCGWSQPQRSQLAQEAAGTFSAAAATIEAVHEGWMTRQYAAASFEGFREQSTRTAAALRSVGLAGVDDASLQQALQVVAEPCLDIGCEWEGQRDVLRATAHELLMAAGA
jgi:hypothetical protein